LQKQLIDIICINNFNAKALDYDAFYYLGANPNLLHNKQCNIIEFPDDKSVQTQEIKEFIVNIDAVFLANTCSGNRYLTSVCDDILRGFSLLKKIQSTIGRIAIVVDTPLDMWKFRKFLAANNVIIKSPPLLFFRIKWALKQATTFIRALKSVICEYVSFPHYTLPSLPISKFTFITWINDPMINKEKLFRTNHYFGCIPEYLSQKNSVAFLGKVIAGHPRSSEIVSNTLQQNLPVTFLQQYIKISDIFYALTHNFKLFYQIVSKNFVYKDGDYTPLVKESLKQDFFSGSFIDSLLHYRLFQRFFKTCNEESVIIYPFENQPWEKALLLAANKVNKSIKLIAHQFFPFPPDLLIYKFSKAARKNGGIPSLFMTSDVISDKRLSDQGIETLQIGTSRYNALLDLPVSLSDKNSAVLCCLSIDPKEATILALKASVITEELGLPLWINYHPLLATDVIENLKKQLSGHNHIQFFDCAASVLIPDSRVVLYNSSTVCLEAALRGIPIIYVECDNLPNLDKFQSLGKNFKEIDDGIALIKQLIDNDQNYQLYSQKTYQIAREILLPINLAQLEKIN
jgi:hypothetical protein